MPADLITEAEGYGFNNGVYPDNFEPLLVFKAMLTQWRFGPKGAAGLDYNALGFVMEVMEVTDKADTFYCVQIMERAALEKIRGS